MYGYDLPASELESHQPNPLWGKHKFDPETGAKVTQFIEDNRELCIEDGEHLAKMTRFTRRDSGSSILLGIVIAETGDLSYRADDPEKLEMLSEADCAKVKTEVEKILHKADLTFEPDHMGYHLVSYVG